MTCNICYEKFGTDYVPSIIVQKATGNSCGHIFCANCIKKFPILHGSISCATCRKSYTNYNIITIFIPEEESTHKPIIKEIFKDFVDKCKTNIVKTADILCKQEIEIQDKISIIKKLKGEIIKTKEILITTREETNREIIKIQNGEGYLFEKEFERRKKEIEEKFKVIEEKRQFEHKEFCKLLNENNRLEKLKIEKDIDKYKKEMKRQYKNIIQEMIKINDDYHQFKVFLKSSKQSFVNYYPTIIKEFFNGVQLIKSLNIALSKREHKYMTRIIKTLTTLDISMFCEYGKKDIIRSEIANSDDITNYGKIIKKELRRAQNIRLPEFPF